MCGVHVAVWMRSLFTVMMVCARTWCIWYHVLYSSVCGYRMHDVCHGVYDITYCIALYVATECMMCVHGVCA